jgi:hypothetical protein
LGVSKEVKPFFYILHFISVSSIYISINKAYIYIHNKYKSVTFCHNRVRNVFLSLLKCQHVDHVFCKVVTLDTHHITIHELVHLVSQSISCLYMGLKSFHIYLITH